MLNLANKGFNCNQMRICNCDPNLPRTGPCCDILDLLILFSKSEQLFLKAVVFGPLESKTDPSVIKVSLSAKIQAQQNRLESESAAG